MAAGFPHFTLSLEPGSYPVCQNVAYRVQDFAVEKVLWLGRSKAAPSNSYPRQKCLKPYHTEVYVK